MPEYPAHPGADHHCTVLIGANHKPKICSFRGTFHNITCPSSKNNIMEILIFRHFIFCNIMAADPIAFRADLDDKKSNRKDF